VKKILLSALCLLSSVLSASAYYYVGVEGGGLTGMSRSTPKLGVGAFGLQGDAVNPRPRAGFEVGGNVGYRFPRYTRSEIAYTFQRQSYDWQAIFPSGIVTPASPVQVQSFQSKVSSHLIFWNQYLQVGDFCPFASNLDPYLLGGLGVAFNRLEKTQEIATNSALTATLAEKSVAQLAFRFGMGTLVSSTQCWRLDAGVQVTYIGEVRSGDTRTTPSGAIQGIGTYRFENNWIGVFNIGIKFLGCPKFWGCR